MLTPEEPLDFGVALEQAWEDDLAGLEGGEELGGIEGELAGPAGEPEPEEPLQSPLGLEEAGEELEGWGEDPDAVLEEDDTGGWGDVFSSSEEEGLEPHEMDDTPDEAALSPKYLQDTISALRKDEARVVEVALKGAAGLIETALDVQMAGLELGAVLLHLNNVYELPNFEEKDST